MKKRQSPTAKATQSDAALRHWALRCERLRPVFEKTAKGKAGPEAVEHAMALLRSLPRPRRKKHGRAAIHDSLERFERDIRKAIAALGPAKRWLNIDTEGLQAQCEEAIARCEAAPDSDFQKGTRVDFVARWLGQQSAEAFYLLTGNAPTRITKEVDKDARHGGRAEEGGPFADFVASVSQIMGVPGVSARRAKDWFSAKHKH